LIRQLSPQELAAWRDDAAREPPLVLDVRERWEYDYCRIEPSLSMPLGELPGGAAALPRHRDIVVVCHHGVRSQHAAAWLARSGFARVHNLAGGVAGWADAVEPAMKRY
jgi:rhodanese-related sulfurtransferase